MPDHGTPTVNMPTPGRVSDRTEYDRDSRTTFTVGDAVETTRTLYDGVGRVIKTIDPEGNTVEWVCYDESVG